MPWFNVDDGAHSHPKVLMAGNAAFGLFTRLGSYSAAYSTEGRIPAAVVNTYGTKTERDKLLAVGLLHRDGDEFVMHDFLDYNRDAAQIARDRAKAAERKRRQRERDQKRDSHGVTSPVTDGMSHGPQAKPSQTSTSITTTAAALTLPPTAAAALRILIEHKVATEADRNPGGYRATLERELPDEHGPALRAVLEANPDATPEQLATSVLGVAIAATVRWCDESCPTCGATDTLGWIDTGHGLAPCPNRLEETA